ncbi:MAG: lytic murein transglycosylase [Acidobacteria bacterium]|nr:lytic murein transglycosylase [Acidobacteriota bacterium]MBI3262405.1 lytic murein transglycosylase [Acidobacteriota bacterium]
MRSRRRTRAHLILAIACSIAAVPAAQQTPPITSPPRVSPSFAEFLAGLREEARDKGITPETIERALGDIEPLPIVIERDRSQAEKVLTLDQYVQRRLTPRMVRTAREMAARHAPLLRRVSSRYGVPAGIIVATWGLESNFGRFSGVRPTIAALATLAFDERRALFFRGELFHALRIIDRGDIDLARMKGSWAGAMGQPQFMPSSYVEFAEDFDGDGRRDIWRSEADVFASIANYLRGHGWTTGERWGRRVSLPPSVAARVEDTVPLRTGDCEATRQMRGPLPLSRWRELGVSLVDRRPLPNSEMAASLVPAGRWSFLAYPNYGALLGYDCAHAYALTLGLLADRIAN